MQQRRISSQSTLQQFQLTAREVWSSATSMIECHGKDAGEIASSQAEAMIDRGDVTGAELWSRILLAIEELQRSSPRLDESIH